jgi:hypothetical protein
VVLSNNVKVVVSVILLLIVFGCAFITQGQDRLLCLIVAAWMTLQFFSGVKRMGSPERRAFAPILALFLLLGTALLYYAIWKTAPVQQISSWIFKRIAEGGPVTNICLTAAMLGIGALLFRLKKKALFAYANLEISFAMVSCYVALEKAQQKGHNAFEVTSVLGAALYLFVRGFDNRDKAREGNVTTGALESGQQSGSLDIAVP